MKKNSSAVILTLFLMIMAGCTGTGVDPTLPDVIPVTPLITPESTTAVPTFTATVLVAGEQPPSTASPINTMESPEAIPLLESPIAPNVCSSPADWVVYTVQVGDTLYSLARKTSTSVEQIKQANCLTSDLIITSQSLHLPFIPPSPSTPMPTQPKIEIPWPPPPSSPAETPVLITASPTVPGAGPTVTATVETPEPPSPGDPHLLVAPYSGPIGTTYTITIEDFKSGETITLTLVHIETETTILQLSTTVDGDGVGAVQFTTLAGDPIGDYLIQAQGNMGSLAHGEFVISE